MNLGEALKREMDRLWEDTGPRSPITGNRGRLARMRELERRNGGPKGAAAAVGVSRETWRRWTQTGPRAQSPSAVNLKRLGSAYDRATRPARLSRLRTRLRTSRPWVEAVINWDSYYNAEPFRHTQLEAVDVSGLVDPWQADSQTQMTDVFELAVSKAYKVGNGRVPAIRFEENNVTVRL